MLLRLANGNLSQSEIECPEQSKYLEVSPILISNTKCHFKSKHFLPISNNNVRIKVRAMVRLIPSLTRIVPS